jgi:hypothetical protein
LFCLYCLFFTIAAETDVLTWRRNLLGYEEQTPHAFLGFNRLGDWRYSLFGKVRAAHDLLIVTVPTAGRSREAIRFDVIRLARMAVDEARGMAIDLRLIQPSLLDPLLCDTLRNSATQRLPIFLGYGHKELSHDLVAREALPPGLQDCIPLENLGHIAGYEEEDGRVRMVPMFLKGDRQLQALSLRVASFLVGSVGNLKLPENGLLQPLQPRGGILIEPLKSLEAKKDILRDQFVLVGSSSPGDRHDTPYHSVQGVVIHAWAVQALRTGQWVRRISPFWSFPGIWLLCYVLIVVWVRGGGPRRLIIWATGLSFMVMGGVALAALCKVWIEASYPLAAIWPLACVLAFSRRSRKLLAAVEVRGKAKG